MKFLVWHVQSWSMKLILNLILILSLLLSCFSKIIEWFSFSPTQFSLKLLFVSIATKLFPVSLPSVFNEEHPPIREEDALAKWVSDPANTAWMESEDHFSLNVLMPSISILCAYH